MAAIRRRSLLQLAAIKAGHAALLATALAVEPIIRGDAAASRSGP